MKRIMKPALLTVAIAIGLSACATAKKSSDYDLDFSKQRGSAKTMQVNGETVAYRAYENIVYVQKPVDTVYQSINIYIPEAYFNGGSINGFTADTAPISFPIKSADICPANRENRVKQASAPLPVKPMQCRWHCRKVT